MLLCLLALTLLSGRSAEAGPVDLWGFGAEQQGRAAGGVALADDPAGLFLNPAGLTRMAQPEMTVAYALQRTALRPLPDVHWDTNRDGRLTDDDTPLHLDPGSLRADALMVSLGRPVGKRFGVGVAFLLPVDRLLRIHTFEPSLPHYLQYEDGPHRYELSAGFGWEQLPGISVGGAVQMIAQGRFDVDTTLTAPVGLADDGDSGLGDLVGPLTLDLHELTLDLSPALVPVASIDWDVGALIPALDGLQVAATYRGSSGLPVDVNVDLQANFNIEEVGSIGPLVFSALAPIQLSLFDHYVPERWSFGLAWRGPHLRLFADAHRLGWDRMRLNVALVTGGGVYSELVALNDPEWLDGNPTAFRFSATWNLGGGVEWTTRDLPGGEAGFLRLTGRAGLAYAPTPLVSQGPDTALLDSDRVALGLGLGVEHGDPFDLVKGPIHWDVFGQVHRLAQGILPVEATDPPRPGAPVDGAPLPIGGTIWSLGLQWGVGF